MTWYTFKRSDSHEFLYKIEQAVYFKISYTPYEILYACSKLKLKDISYKFLFNCIVYVELCYEFAFSYIFLILNLKYLDININYL